MYQPFSSSSVFNLYAYPTQLPPDTIIYLYTQISAIVSYILGPTWQLSAPTIPSKNLLVPQPPTTNWTTADESALALRMLRGGAAITNISYTPYLAWQFESLQGPDRLPAARRQKYIFAWPDTGGVWVLSLPPYTDHSAKSDEQQISDEIEQMLMWDEIVDDVFRDFDGGVHYGDLVGVEAMEEFCGKLKGKGAVFYERIGESGEVREMGSVDEEDA